MSQSILWEKARTESYGELNFDFPGLEKFSPSKNVWILPNFCGALCSSAKNIVTSERVAVKKIGNAFQNPVDAQRTLREIRILRHMNHENVVSIKDILPPLNRENFKDVYLVYELMDTDLHQLIRSPQLLSDAHIQYFIYQVGMTHCTYQSFVRM